MLSGQRKPDAEVEGIIYDVQILTQQVQQLTFYHTPRNCNRAAHEVAAYAFRNGGCFSWGSFLCLLKKMTKKRNTTFLKGKETEDQGLCKCFNQQMGPNAI